MKKIISLMLIICLCAALFACTEEPTVTETKDETTADVETKAPDTGTVTDTDITETEQITETQEQTETETATEAAPDGEKIYGVYDPTIAEFDYSGTLTLFSDGRYSYDLSYTDTSYGYAVHSRTAEEGVYSLEGAEAVLTAKTMGLKITFDREEDKEAYLSDLRYAYGMGSFDGASYDVLKNAASGGFSGDVSELADSGIFGNTANTDTKVVLDEAEMKAYYLVYGITPADNEYYIVGNGYTLALNGDGTCKMYYEGLDEDEKGFGTYIVTDVYKGTYTRSGDQATCEITQNTLKYKFTEQESEDAYREYYEGQYSGGFLGKVYYDYYMALISDGGYTDNDMSDKYIITLEEHTHTAVILESPDSEL